MCIGLLVFSISESMLHKGWSLFGQSFSLYMYLEHEQKLVVVFFINVGSLAALVGKVLFAVLFCSACSVYCIHVSLSFAIVESNNGSMDLFPTSFINWLSSNSLCCSWFEEYMLNIMQSSSQCCVNLCCLSGLPL